MAKRRVRTTAKATRGSADLGIAYAMKFIDRLFAKGETPTCTAVASLIVKDLSFPKSFKWKRDIDRQRAILFTHDGARALAGAAIRATDTKSRPRPDETDQLILEYEVQARYVISDDETGEEIIVKTKDEVASEHRDHRLRKKVEQFRAIGDGNYDSADKLERYLDHLFPRTRARAA
jgi:hypothetical protein